MTSFVRRELVRRTLICGIAATALLSTASGAVSKVEPPTLRPIGQRSSAPEVVPGEVIVRYKDVALRAGRDLALRRVGAKLKRRLLLRNAELLAVPKGSEKAAAAALSRDPSVLYAEPNRYVHIDATPNDARFGSMWGLHNTGQKVSGKSGAADADIDAPEAWNLALPPSPSVLVAVIDTGVAMNHPDLSAHIFVNSAEANGTAGVDDDGNGKIDDINGWDIFNNDNNPSDDSGHGTHVAGTIAARANNSSGVPGVASFPAVSGAWNGPKILPIKVFPASGGATTAQIADGMTYAGQMKADVANMSLSGSGTSLLQDDVIKSFPNTLFIVSAGNESTDNDGAPRFPCNSSPLSGTTVSNKICVAASDAEDGLASFSSFGDGSVHLVAPGVSVLSTVRYRVFFEVAKR